MKVDTAIIGAGPYGLSIAAHLRRSNANFRVFGKPMDMWQNHMPKGMLLKSDGFASNLSAPLSGYGLAEYCRDRTIPYDDLSTPVRLKTFVEYGLEFQKRFIPEVDNRLVKHCKPVDKGFELTLLDGATIEARNVISAVGLLSFAKMPKELDDLPGELATHSSAHSCLAHFNKQDVTVIGAGSSAIELSALLHEAGATVRLVVRGSVIRFGSSPKHGARRTVWQRIRHPQSGLGPGWRSRIACGLPDLFRFMPSTLRLEIVRRHLGPASAWHIEPRIMGRVPVLLNHRIVSAADRNGQVLLNVKNMHGNAITIKTDHVISATGYEPNIDQLCFIDRRIRSEIHKVGKMPNLSRNFESSWPGLYFAGVAASGSFGPLMRFVYGCEFAARRISDHILSR